MSNRSRIVFLFYIKRTKLLQNGEAAIYLRIKVGNSESELSIMKSIRPDNWCPEKKGAIGKTKEALEVNKHIEHIRKQLYSYIDELRDEGSEITANALKCKLTGQETEERTIVRVFNDHNQSVKLLVGKDFAPATLQRYETCHLHIKDYIKEKYNLADLNINKIDPDFIRGLELYLKTTRGCNHNTTMKYIKNFKKIVRICLGNGWMKKDPFINIRFKVQKVERPFLTEEEINIIMNKDFPCERLRLVADVFIFGCFTGYAYTDLKHLTPSNLFTDEQGKLWIHAHRQKTKIVSHVPVLPPVKKILDKYKNHKYCIKHNVLLPVLTNQKLNGYLKEIADLCGIQKNLTTHIARHTFATTVTLNNDVPIESVSKMLGHSTITMTQNYAKLLDKKVGNDMKKVMEKFKPDSPPAPRELLETCMN
jgi:site-specific recombinase XerD